MKILQMLTVFTVLLLLSIPSQADSPRSVIGVWTKTTSADYNNVAIFYQEANQIKAIGFGKPGTPAVWWAEGNIEGNEVSCTYQYSKDAIPDGWEPEGTFRLTLSDDGNVMTGTAKSNRGSWSGQIQFKKITIDLGKHRNLASKTKK